MECIYLMCIFGDVYPFNHKLILKCLCSFPATCLKANLWVGMKIGGPLFILVGLLGNKET
jgi:hypothetical protein